MEPQIQQKSDLEALRCHQGTSYTAQTRVLTARTEPALFTDAAQVLVQLSLWHRHTMGSKQAPGGATHVTHGGLTAGQRSQGLFFQGGLSPQGWARAAACL